MNRVNRHPRIDRSLLIEFWNQVVQRPSRSRLKNNLGGNERALARARLQSDTPISNDADLLKLQEQAAEYVCEAKRRDPSGPNEMVSTVIDAIARYYFGHVIRKQQPPSL